MVVILAVMSLVILSVILLTPGKKELLEKWKQQSHRGEELQCGELKERCEFFWGGEMCVQVESLLRKSIFSILFVCL